VGPLARLQEAPLLVRWARDRYCLLFFKWECPTELEEFLVPIVNGIDWRLPDWLSQKIDLQPQASRVNDSNVTFMDDIGDA
jgi:hypothetical protein